MGKRWVRNGEINGEINQETSDTNPRLKVSTNQPIVEGAEDGTLVVVEIENGVFDENVINNANIYFEGLPQGVGTSEMRLVSENRIEAVLSGNSVIDYDENYTEGRVAVYPPGIKDYEVEKFEPITASLTFKAVVEPNEPSLSISEAVMHESESDDGSIAGFQTITISGGTFTQDVARYANLDKYFERLNPMFTRISDTELKLSFSGNNVGLGPISNSSAIVSISKEGIVDFEKGLRAPAFDVEFIGTPRLEISKSGTIIEGAEGNGAIYFRLHNLEFKTYQDLNKDIVELINAPEGVTVEGTTLYSLSDALIYLDGASTVDYDSDLEVGVKLDFSALDTGVDSLVSENTITFVAVQE